MGMYKELDRILREEAGDQAEYEELRDAVTLLLEGIKPTFRQEQAERILIRWENEEAICGGKLKI